MIIYHVKHKTLHWQRYTPFELQVTERHNNKLCIAGTNTFNGNVRKKADTYLSTHRKGIGTGLTSISITAEKYGGFAQFSNSDTQFYSDI